jgi:NADH-quinone oxidoreductase subunit A
LQIAVLGNAQLFTRPAPLGVGPAFLNGGAVYEQYVTLATLAFVAVILGGTILILNKILGPKHWTKSKLDTFETGNEPEGDARQRFSIRFYLVAILFILFDIEVVFLFPWAVTLGEIGWLGFLSMMGFLSVLTVGFIYEWRKGALDWQ